MKIVLSIVTILAAVAIASPLASSEAEAEAHVLEKRTSCKWVRAFLPDKTGTCIDINKKVCTGTLKQGLCPGGNNIICCL